MAVMAKYMLPKPASSAAARRSATGIHGQPRRSLRLLADPGCGSGSVNNDQAENDEEDEESQADDRGLDQLAGREHEEQVGLLPGGQRRRRRGTRAAG